MKQCLAILMCLWLGSVGAGQTDPGTSGAGRKAAVLDQFGQKKLKAKGKRAVLPFGEIDQHLVQIAKWIESSAAPAPDAPGQAAGEPGLTYGDLFRPNKPACLFPLTNNVVRLCPEDSLAGITVFDAEGNRLGTFSNKYRYSHEGERSFVLVFFQFLTPAGILRKTGPDLLLDHYLVVWEDIRERPCLEWRRTK